jgi:hypothetical protein
MSDTEHIIGKLIPIEGDPQVEARKILEDSKYQMNEGDEDAVSELCSVKYKQYAFINGILYKIEAKDYEYSDSFFAKKNPDGTYDFNCRYYNGGMCLDEAIERAINGEGDGDA